jgi:hypothetical protein
MTPDVFLLDANVLITAKNSYYGFSLCPGFWDALVAAHQQNRVFSLDKVRDELLKGDDDLVTWVKTKVPEGFFLNSVDADVVKHFGVMQNWAAQNAKFTPGAREDFARVADGWLVAAAQAKGLVVVTLEGHQPEARRRVPIPNVCRQFSVRHANTFEMLRALRATFRLHAQV